MAPPAAGSRLRPGGLLPGLFVLTALGAVLLLRANAAPFVLALLLAWAGASFQSLLRRSGLGPALAALVTTAVVTLLFFGLLVVIGFIVAGQVTDLIAQWPAITAKLGPFARDVLTQIGVQMRTERMAWLLNNPWGLLSADAGSVVSLLISLIGSTLAAGLLVLLTPFLTFYFLKDGRKLIRQTSRWFSQRHRAQMSEFIAMARQRLKDFFSGMLVLCAVQAVFHAVGLWLIGLQFGILIGLMTGAASLIPVLGNTTMLLVAVTMAIIQNEGWLLPLLVAGLYGLSELLETAVLAPNLIGNRIQVHPLFVVAALVVGGSLFGLLGAVLALPFAAIVSTFFEDGNGAESPSSPVGITGGG